MVLKSLLGQYSFFWWPVLTLLLLQACQDTDYDIPKNVQSVNVEYVRYDDLFFRSDTSIQYLRSEYPVFTEVFIRNILGLPWRDSLITQLRESPELALIQDDIEMVFPNEQELSGALNSLFSFAKHYFPTAFVPTVYFFNSLFNYGALTIGDSTAAVGLDFFLGADYAKYPQDIFPQYIRETMTADYWPSKLAEAWINEQLETAAPERMIDYAINNGIVLYLKKKLLPKTPDTVIFEYTEDQLEWLYENESEIWSFLIQEEILYSRNFRDFQKLVNPSPAGINGMPAETPGRAGNFVGYRIVEAYMKRNETVTPEDLLTLEDYNTFFQASKYKPRLK